MSRRIPASDFSNPPVRQPRSHVDHRGIWIGKDAFSVPKYYTAVEEVAEHDSDEEFDFTGVDLTRTSPVGGKGKGREKETTPEADGHGRSAKRRKVVQDFGFLEADLPHTTASSSASAFAVPSSVNCISLFLRRPHSDKLIFVGFAQVCPPLRVQLLLGSWPTI